MTTGQRQLDYLFVVTYGRSGSTLLMGLLNSIPGYLIRGENWDALHHLYLFHQTLDEGSRRWQPARLRQRTHPFYGAGDFPARRSLEGIRALVLDTVLRPRPDTRVTGFKEIRWYRDDVEAYVGWLRKVFPGARFVINTRDHAEVGRSGWWAKHPDGAIALPGIEARLLELGRSLGDAAYHVHYNDYAGRPAALRGLFAWLGEPYDEARLSAVLETRHSVGGR